jgi:FMN phosphatase YigB (HAD superfamily)
LTERSGARPHGDIRTRGRIPALVPAVTFDIWHTLVRLPPADEDRYLALQESKLAEVVRDSPSAGRVGGHRVVDPDAAARLAFAAANRRRGVGTPVAGLAVEAARLAGRQPRPRAWIRCVETYVDRLPFKATSGARAELRRLTETGFRTAVVSNLVGETGRSMRRVLRRLGMGRYIESWAFSDELPWAKPAPEIFWQALRPLGVEASAAVHVGDLGPDIQGARAAGFRSAILYRGANQYGPRYAAVCRTNKPIDPPADHELRAWSDLAPLLVALFPETDTTSREPRARRCSRELSATRVASVRRRLAR